MEQIVSIIQWFFNINSFLVGVAYLFYSWKKGEDELSDRVVNILKEKDALQQKEIESLQVRVKNQTKELSVLKEVLAESLIDNK